MDSAISIQSLNVVVIFESLGDGLSHINTVIERCCHLCSPDWVSKVVSSREILHSPDIIGEHVAVDFEVSINSSKGLKNTREVAHLAFNPILEHSCMAHELLQVSSIPLAKMVLERSISKAVGGCWEVV